MCEGEINIFNLYPHVDPADSQPINMFTVMFALGRVPGWIAQWKEMHEDPKQKIARPRQLFTGKTVRKYKSVSERL